jgi:hypothetical protein
MVNWSADLQSAFGLSRSFEQDPKAESNSALRMVNCLPPSRVLNLARLPTNTITL